MSTTTLKEPPKPNVIVMAEDDLDDRLLIKDALAETNWPADLRFVDNGEEMMAYLTRTGKYATADAPRPNLILLDLNMPRKDGREVLREMKTHSDLKRIPVVVLTTSKADTDIDKTYELGANSFISKPIEFDSLVKLMGLLAQYWLKTVELPNGK